MNKCCDLHKEGKYKKWKCGSYDPKKRKSIFENKKHKCVDCEEMVSDKALRCRKCSNKRFFQGEEASYNAKHRWLQRNVKKPELCGHCGEKKILQWANISKKYLRDLSDWIALCVKCHHIFDNNFPPIQKKKICKISTSQSS